MNIETRIVAEAFNQETRRGAYIVSHYRNFVTWYSFNFYHAKSVKESIVSDLSLDEAFARFNEYCHRHACDVK